ncbi:TetR/AcrR family transcriptional regulator [Mycobacterium sp.]|uniref:TetR/AcrR family transcriptional regulator n=1 Tax=Mycobacterium sp. TaxID=1785 RepID=UPI0025F65D85|nr:TetR/AcrR family transcriptional regulator [Mycobacterium sp.]
MSARPYRARGVNAGLSADDIVDTALEFIDDESFQTLTMRKLAKRLRVSPMAIYRHVADKQELLSLVADRYFEELATPEQAPESPRYVEEWFVALHRLMIKRPVLAHVMAAQPLGGAVAWRKADSVIGTLVACGTSPNEAGELITALLTFTIGFTLVGLARDEERSATNDVISRAQGEFPHLAGGLKYYYNWLGEPAFARGISSLIEARIGRSTG